MIPQMGSVKGYLAKQRLDQRIAELRQLDVVHGQGGEALAVELEQVGMIEQRGEQNLVGSSGQRPGIERGNPVVATQAAAGLGEGPRTAPRHGAAALSMLLALILALILARALPLPPARLAVGVVAEGRLEALHHLRLDRRAQARVGDRLQLRADPRPQRRALLGAVSSHN